MIKKLLLFSVFCSSLLATPHIPHDTAQLAKQVFGATGVNISLVSFHFVEDLLYRIATSTPYEQQCACTKAAAVLTQELEKREIALTTADAETKQRIEHNLAILTIQKDHYERVARLLKKEITGAQKVRGLLKNILTRFLSFVLSPFKKYTPPLQKLTNDLVMYTDIERNEILTDHKKTLRLLVCQNKYNVPLIIRFWDYPRHRHRLLNGVKKFQGSAQPQAEALAEEIGDAVATTLENEAKTGVETGVVAGDQEATETLETVGESFKDAWQSLLNIDVEGLAEGADAASEETIVEVADALAPVTDGLEAVDDATITFGEATVLIQEATTATTESFGEQAVREVLAHTGQVAARKTAQAAGEDATTQAATKATVGTGEQTTNTFASKAEEETEQEAEETAEEAAADTGKKLTKAEKAAAKAAAKIKQQALEATAKETAATAKAAAQDAKTAEKVAAQAAKAAQKATEDVSKAEADLAKAQAMDPLGKGNTQAIKEALRTVQDAEGAANTATQEAERTATIAKESRAAANTAKATAKAAAKTAFPNVKTWAEQGKEFAEMMGNLVLQMEVSMGAQMVAAWQSAADALVFASLSQKRTTLMTNLNHFFSQLAVQQTNILAQINANFSAQIAVIAAQLCLQTTSTGSVVLSGLLPALFAVEQSFITQALVTATVKSVFLLNPMPDDQLFYQSAMAAQQVISSHTPFTSNGLSTTWYNPYRSGNWQFCSTDYSGTSKGPVTSFVQYGAQPFTTSYAPDGTTISSPNGDPTQAVQNSIFTEYIPPVHLNQQSVESYTISVACTLLSEPYEPFMMGIMFNGARWISGILDLHHQHRLFCIYSLPGQKAGTYNVGFAETFYQNQGQMNQTQDQLSDQNIAGLNAIWPAYQILSPDINKLAALAKASAATPVTNPIATIPALPIGTPYIFTIETQPNQVTLTISTSDGKILYPAGETAASLNNTLSLPNQIQKLNGLTFLYHSIGFTAPGCSAQFCLKKPAALRFSESQIKTIQASLNKGMS